VEYSSALRSCGNAATRLKPISKGCLFIRATEEYRPHFTFTLLGYRTSRIESQSIPSTTS
jgi:hypothetical protein